PRTAAIRHRQGGCRAEGLRGLAEARGGRHPQARPRPRRGATIWDLRPPGSACRSVRLYPGASFSDHLAMIEILERVRERLCRITGLAGEDQHLLGSYGEPLRNLGFDGVVGPHEQEACLFAVITCTRHWH